MEDERRAAADGLLAILRRETPFKTPAVVSGFWPIKEEIDIRPLMIELFNSGCQMVLPVVQGRGKPLLFRAWRPGDPLDNAIRQNVIDNVAKLKSATPILNAAVEQGKLRVVGGIYRLKSGKVEIIA